MHVIDGENEGGLLLTDAQKVEKQQAEMERMLKEGREAIANARVSAEELYVAAVRTDRPELREAAAGVLVPVVEMSELLAGMEGKDVAAVLTAKAVEVMKECAEKARKKKGFGEVVLSDIVTLRQRALDLGTEIFRLYPKMPKPFGSELDYAMKRVTDLRILLLDQQVNF